MLNDTEQTIIRLESYSIVGINWTAAIEVTIMDHFGLDKHDVLSSQHIHDGFPAWWTLQHRKGFVPFKTRVVARKILRGHL